MGTIEYNLIVEQKIALMDCLIDLLPDESILTLEGDLSQLDLRGLRGIILAATVYPTDARVMIPIDDLSKGLIIQNILPRVGITNRIANITAETKAGHCLFCSNNCFMDDSVYVSGDIISQQIVNLLMQQKIIRNYSVSDELP